VWRKDGRELYFFSPDQQVMSVDVSESGAGLQLGVPGALFKATTVSAPAGPYAASAVREEIRNEHGNAAIDYRTAHPGR
jgi:hypothetical protein